MTLTMIGSHFLIHSVTLTIIGSHFLMSRHMTLALIGSHLLMCLSGGLFFIDPMADAVVLVVVVLFWAAVSYGLLLRKWRTLD